MPKIATFNQVDALIPQLHTFLGIVHTSVQLVLEGFSFLYVLNEFLQGYQLL